MEEPPEVRAFMQELNQAGGLGGGRGPGGASPAPNGDEEGPNGGGQEVGGLSPFLETHPSAANPAAVHAGMVCGSRAGFFHGIRQEVGGDSTPFLKVPLLQPTQNRVHAGMLFKVRG